MSEYIYKKVAICRFNPRRCIQNIWALNLITAICYQQITVYAIGIIGMNQKPI